MVLDNDLEGNYLDIARQKPKLLTLHSKIVKEHPSIPEEHASGRSEIHSIVEDRAEIKPAPAQNLEVGEVGLRQLIDDRGFVFERVGGLDHDEGRTGDQIMRLRACLGLGD